MGNRVPTIYDVSRVAGVSTATVSRYMNRPEMLHEGTRLTVERAIQSLGYKPLVEARLRKNKAVTRICVCSPRFTDSSFVHRLRGITSALAGDPNIELQVFSVDTKDHFDRFIDMLPFRRLDGLIFLSLCVSEEQAARIRDFDVQSVFVEHPSQTVNSVVIDDYAGGRMTADAFLKRGRRNFGIVGERKQFDLSVNPNVRRRQGFTERLAEAGIEMNLKYDYDVRCHAEDAYKLFADVFRTGDFPEAIFALSDDQAIGIYRAARETGVRIPDDLALIGFDDIDFAAYLGLTTIRQHLDQSGQVAVELLRKQLQSPDSVTQMVNLPLELIERTTV